MKTKMDPKKSIRTFPHFPTVLVGCGKEERTNLITVALVHVFSFDPPCIGIGIAPQRYSFELLKDHPEFTINIPMADQLGAVMTCGTLSGRDTDKFEKTGLSFQKSQEIDTYGVKECPVTMECKVMEEITIGDHVWFIGEVVHSFVLEELDRQELVLYWGGEFRVPGELLRERS